MAKVLTVRCDRCADCALRGRLGLAAAVDAGVIDDNDDRRIHAVDLITHLMHMADVDEWDFEAMLEQSRRDHAAETNGDDCGPSCPRHGKGVL